VPHLADVYVTSELCADILFRRGDPAPVTLAGQPAEVSVSSSTSTSISASRAVKAEGDDKGGAKKQTWRSREASPARTDPRPRANKTPSPLVKQETRSEPPELEAGTVGDHDEPESEDREPGTAVVVADEGEHNRVLHRYMDHVLRTLRDVPDHSTPFLRPVTVKIAPDYFDVIETPMDFATMGRKLASGAYRGSLDAFKVDLFLIFENCRTYNSEPDNEYVQSADIMEMQANVLLADIPEIIIKSKRSPAQREPAPLMEPEPVPVASPIVVAAAHSAAVEYPAVPDMRAAQWGKVAHVLAGQWREREAQRKSMSSMLTSVT
jgi:hypothetical protein